MITAAIGSAIGRLTFQLSATGSTMVGSSLGAISLLLHDPQELIAFDRGLLESLGTALEAGDTELLIRLVDPLDCRWPSKRMRQRHGERATKLEERGAPEILTRWEQYLSNPKAFVLEDLRKGTLNVDVLNLAAQKRLPLNAYRYGDVSWLACPDYDCYMRDLLETAGLLSVDAPRENTAERQKARDEVRRARIGSSRIVVAGVGIFDGMRYENGFPDWNLNWHDREGIQQSIAAYDRLLDAEPPAEADILFSGHVQDQISMMSERPDETRAAFSGALRRRLYFETVTETVKTVRKVRQFFVASQKRNLEVLCAANI